MSAVNLASVMDGIAGAITSSGLIPNVYAWPVESITVPCAVVGYPGSVDISVTFQRGGDHLEIPVWLVVGKTGTKDARDALSAYIAGVSDVCAAIEGAYSWGDTDVTEARVATFTASAIDYISLELTVDVAT